ncbi:molybdopterin-dependent oxidoreductase [Halomonas marinisediminis]|uniref:molybdopterin-dependent oxidoreductase n=1 Tax=Halomonas marinisediminis TaxID=2546095 RepID=UPI001F0EC0DC|nr:molybdopterin-dependent oxidoreductase [Halomonas marinisediminis]
MRFPIRFLLLLLALLLVAPAASLAAHLPVPQGPTLLTVTGEVSHPNVGDEVHFDRQMLRELPWHLTVTDTPWHDGKRRFEGPLGRTLLEAVGARGEALRVTALNGYAATLPVSDLQQHDVIFAMAIDGAPLRIRDHGPLFIIYPFDDNPELLNERVLNHSVWQVSHIDVR